MAQNLWFALSPTDGNVNFLDFLMQIITYRDDTEA